jgi:SAM-dependent methyltransferase
VLHKFRNKIAGIARRGKRTAPDPFYGNFCEFKERSDAFPSRFSLNWEDRMPCLSEATSTTSFDAHYVFHTAWAARILAETRPSKHVDISSDIRFVTIASAFVPMEFFDYRPVDFGLPNLSSGFADLQRLPFADGSVGSLSCMHVVEHIGLGRYGDNLDPNGDMKAIAELKRVLAPGGSLLFAVPIGGMAKIVFNAHRIYTYAQVEDCFGDLTLKKSSLILDDKNGGRFIENASEELANLQEYGCGCFWFAKPAYTSV